MSKTRCINTSFWDDDYIRLLSPVDKFLFLYFMTNPLTNIAGCYKTTKDRMLFDLNTTENNKENISLDRLSKAIDMFQKDEKIYYLDGWIFIKNFIKNQSINSKVKIGIQIILKEIEGKVRGILIDYDSLSICFDNNNPNPNLNSNLNLNSNSNLISKTEVLPEVKKEEIIIDQEIGKQINELIELFKEVNLTYTKLFSNKTERNVIERFLKDKGFDITKKLIMAGIKYQDQFTAITKPTEFERNINKIILKKKTGQSNKITEIIYEQ